MKHIQNFTDVDDKMIAAASDAGITVRELAESNIRRYLHETDALNVLRAHEYPRATQHMPDMLRMITALVDDEFAYEESGDVYFRVKSDDDYGKLSRRSQEDLMAGARLEINETKEYAMGLRPLEKPEARRAGVGQPLGTGTARLAHRVQRHVRRAPGQDPGHSRRRPGPDLSPPRERARSKRVLHRRRPARQILASQRHAADRR